MLPAATPTNVAKTLFDIAKALSFKSLHLYANERAASTGEMFAALLFDLRPQGEFDGGAEGQFRDADGGPGVTARVAENAPIHVRKRSRR